MAIRGLNNNVFRREPPVVSCCRQPAKLYPISYILIVGGSSHLLSDSAANSLYLSRADVNEDLGTYSKHPFELDGKEWLSVEHYYQAMKFSDEGYQEKVRHARNPRQARKFGRNRFKKIRGDWRKVKVVFMTRAVYIKCRTYPYIAQRLLATGEKRLVENSQYDYYWGCGRDRRGENRYGRILMDVRNKLREEAQQNDNC